MPCICIGKRFPVDPPAPKDCPECLIAHSSVLSGDESANPCGIDHQVALDVENCSGSIAVNILSFPDAFTEVSTDNTNIYFVTNTVDKAVPGNYYDIHFLVLCDDDETSDTGFIRVFIKDNCKNKQCSSDEICNPCNGDCELPCLDITACEPVITKAKIDLIAKQ